MPSNRIKVQIVGIEVDNFDVRFDDFIKQLTAIRSALTETDRLISHKQSAYYRVVNLRHESPAEIELEVVPKEPKADYSEAITDTFGQGLRMIQENREAPEIFDGQALRAFRNLTPMMMGKQVTDLRVSWNGSSMNVRPTLAHNIDFILGPDQYENGAVSGRMEQINIHAGLNVFRVYSTLEGYNLRCLFPKELREQAVLAVDKHVTVYGRMKYKSRDVRPYEMQVQDIETHLAMSELPTLGQLRGIAPNATGGIASEDFIRKIRDEWGEAQSIQKTE
ncbi:MAG TPA: hypothetical protein VFA07_05570 [Chthonomonadaceae bacterium]|nr:hypothetical protein [Chthonomonadaceae bacterium]